MDAIIVFGDCYAYGRGERPTLGWVGRLKQEYEQEKFYKCVYNQGIPGDTLDTLIERFPIEAKHRVRYLKKRDRFKIIIQTGTNDVKGIENPDNYSPKDEVENKTLQIIKLASDFVGIENIIWVGMPPVDEVKTKLLEPQYYFSNKRISEYNKVFRNICLKKGGQFIDIFDKLSESTHYIENLTADGYHPNGNGYATMYDIIKNQLSDKQIYK